MHSRLAFRATAHLLFIVCVAISLASCGKGSSGPGSSASARNSGAPRQLKPNELTEAERKYGIAPIPDDTIKYQPDVILVGGGAESIRSESANGFGWTIDANAAHADELVPGKVMFLTGRAVGRVLDVRRNGDALAVTLGPVDITDIVREADIVIKDMPIDFDGAIAYTSKDLPGQEVPLARASENEPARAIPAMLRRTDNRAGQPPPPEPGWDVSKLVNFKKIPTVSAQGIGIRLSSDAGGLKVNAQVNFALKKPTLDVTLRITPLGVQEASIALGGTAGVNWQFGVGTDLGRSANVRGIVEPDTDFSLPIGGIGPLPISITVRQRFLIRTALGVRNASLTARGDYEFTGAIKAGYFNGKWQLAGPTNVTASQSLIDNTGGVSITAAGVDMAHVIRVTVGIGAHGFTAGPYVAFTSSVGLFKGSDLGMLPCREATIVMSAHAGVGYSIPQIATKIINTFLSFIGIKHQITGEGTLPPSPAITIHKNTSTLKACLADKG